MKTLTTSLAAVALCGVASANEVLVAADIAVSTTWTADNYYNLQDQIYVLPGATLTIEAGTVIASSTNLGGSLAVAKGAQIFVQGTKDAPVIMTSLADVATWDVDGSHPTGGDPTTGTWREAANEWGNLTIMGDGYISEDATAGNVPTPDPGNVAAMEGLTEDFAGDPKVLYGGGNDDDDSGSISHLSMRYGGKVIALNNELNGLSLGGLGRGTDISFVEIMNNVDDGIEIWGGTLCIKNFSIWNIGDDSFDVDQGWRGKAQFGLIVQGYSLNASQGSGVGDNCVEIDGAENSDWQPVTTTSLYNLTVIGNPEDGDGLTAWRDNARVQYRNSIFMDGGEKVVRFDNLDGDGAQGYGFNGTLSWTDTWATAAGTHSTVNAPPNPGDFYTTQIDGNLCEITDSVFYNNTNSSAYTEANNVNVFASGNCNVLEPANSPITSITRGPVVTKGGKDVAPCIGLDPRPANDALTSCGSAPNDGFFTPADYRGAFQPGLPNSWLADWTASDAFGYTDEDLGATVYCADSLNVEGDIRISSCSLADNPILSTENSDNGLFGYYLVGTGTTVVTNPPGATGTLCLAGAPIGRYVADLQVFSGGAVSIDLVNGAVGGGSANLPNPPRGSIMAGDSWNFQLWARVGGGSGFSPAITVNFTN